MFGAGRRSIPRPVTRNLEDLDSVQSVLLHSVPHKEISTIRSCPTGQRRTFKATPKAIFFALAKSRLNFMIKPASHPAVPKRSSSPVVR
ncbi:unnamed protein product [Bubo scandiacus]